MNALNLVLAALALVPQPRNVVEFGGETANTAKTFRVDASIPKEGYRLKVTDAGAEIAYADAAGARKSSSRTSIPVPRTS